MVMCHESLNNLIKKNINTYSTGWTIIVINGLLVNVNIVGEKSNHEHCNDNEHVMRLNASVAKTFIYSHIWVRR